MPIGDKIEDRGHITGFREEIEKAAGRSADDFFTWFDAAADADASFIRGEWDFALHIANKIAPYVKEPEKKTILEIGYGGGRILAAAARSFGKAVGVDIHPNQALVDQELKKRGANNFQLFTADGTTLPCPDSSIDVVYTFIVLQHVERIAIWRAYFEETWRVLRPGGVAMLYFGRWAPFSLGRERPLAYWAERMGERFFLTKGYLEKPAHVNDTNLLVTVPYAKGYAKRLGFQVKSATVSRRRVPDGLAAYGSQHGLLLVKPR